MEIVRQKNVATRIVFPIVDADGDVVSGAAGLDSEFTYWDDGSNPGSFSDLTNGATEIGSTGIYYINLTQSEMNHDYIYIRIQTTTSGAKTQHILIRTMIGDPLNLATTASGALVWSAATRALTDKVGFGLADGAITAAKIATDAITAAKIAAGAITSSEAPNLDAAISSRSSHSAADVWSAASRELSTPDNYKADISGLATGAALSTHDGKLDTVDGIVDAIKVKTDNLPSNTETILNRIKGLQDENCYDDNYSYSDGKCSGFRRRIYDSKANAQAHGATGLLATYTITVDWSGDNINYYLVVLE